jgi:Fe-S cluster assembly protein SufD
VLVETHDHVTGSPAAPVAAGGVVHKLQVHVLLGAGARLVHLRVVRPQAQDRIAHDVQVHLEAGARYAAALLATTSRYHLQRATLALDGERAGAAMGTVLLGDGATVDQQVRARHAAAATASTIETLALARGAARLVANGHTRIASGCSGADARQRLVAIPTGGNPRVTLRPHLEIHHDDVQAVHGATFGALPQDALFHARQRGLDEGTAQALIVAGLARATLARVLPEPAVLADGGLDALLDTAVQGHLRIAGPEANHG